MLSAITRSVLTSNSKYFEFAFTIFFFLMFIFCRKPRSIIYRDEFWCLNGGIEPLLATDFNSTLTQFNFVERCGTDDQLYFVLCLIASLLLLATNTKKLDLAVKVL